MEFRSILWVTLAVLWSANSLKLEPLGLYLAHDIAHPLDISSSRHVRDVSRSRHHQNRGGFIPFKYCCGGDNNTEISNKNQSIGLVDSCLHELEEEEDEWNKYGNPTKDPFNCEATKKFKDLFNCFFNCLMKAQGVLGNDTEDIDKWEELTTEPLAFPWLKDLGFTAFHKCVANKDYSWLKNGDNLKCSTRAMDVNHCVWREIILTCPEEHYVKNAYCKRVKEAFVEVDA